MDREALLHRVRNSVFLRPALYILGGLALAWLMLSVDHLLGEEAVPGALRFPPQGARILLATLAGATLTIAGITFWVRAASVQLAAGQYSPRVVHGFLQDWFQQSMMGLLVGFFAYIVSVFRVLPDVPDPASPPPHLAIVGAVVLAGGSVMVVLAAIRNGVRSMQAGELARRIAHTTLDQIRDVHPPRRPGGPSPVAAGDAPARKGVVIRAQDEGWVQRIRQPELLGALPTDATVRLDVRVGLFVSRGRPLCTVWSEEGLALGAADRIRRAVRLGRFRSVDVDIDYGIHQLVDVAVGSLSQGVADTGGAYEVLVHLEMVLRELLLRELPPTAFTDPEGRWVLRPREFGFDDYVRDAFDRLRMAAAPHPTVAAALVTTIGTLVTELEESGRLDAVAPLRRQGRLAVAACEAAGLLDDDLELVSRVARRYGFETAA